MNMQVATGRNYDIFLPQERVEKETPLWSNRILTQYVAEHAFERAEHVAIAEVRPDSEVVPEAKREPCVISYRQLWREARFLAFYFRKMGIQPGDMVSVQLPNWAEFVIIALALARIGAVINSIAPIYRRKEMSFFLRRSHSKALVIPTVFRGFNFLKMAEELRCECPDLEMIWTVGDPSLSTSLDPPYSIVGKTVPSEEEIGPMPDPNEVALVIFTAGTTGEPKGALHTHNTADFVEKALAEVAGLTSEDVFWFPSTVGHGTGHFHGVIGAMRLGATLVLPDKWDRKSIDYTLNKWHCTYTVGATPFLIDTIEHASDQALRHMRIFLCGGAYIPEEVMRRACRRIPNCSVLRCWGQAENSTVTVSRPGDPIEKVICTDGRLNLNKELQVRDPETNRVLPPGVEGELWTRGPSLFVGYLNSPELTRKSIDEDGWFQTGDRGRLDNEGYLTMSGRSKDIIIRGGENFPVKEMEDLLSTHPAIAEVAIVAMPDRRLQEKACAFIAVRPGTHYDFQEMLRFLDSQGMAKRKYPEHLEILPELPKTISGKIKKRDLRIMIAEKIGLPPINVNELAY
jgi:non-ribosomal peptide synthetase component E (peptide arylation enzyme)